MKKLLISLLIVMLLLPSLLLCVSADNVYETLKMETELPEKFAATDNIEYLIDYANGEGVLTNSIQDYGLSAFYEYVYLKQYNEGPNGEQIPVDESYCIYEFEVAEEGTYEFLIEIMAYEGQKPRTGLVQIDDGPKYYINSVHGDRHLISEYYTGLTAKLDAGEHTFTIYLGDDFNDDTVKSLFFHTFSYLRVADMDGNPIDPTATESATETDTVAETTAAETTVAEITSTDTTVAAPAETTAATADGCASVIGTGTLLSLIGAAWVMKKRF